MRVDVVTCRLRETARECARLMLEYDVGLVPVLDDEDRVVGVVTDRHLVTRILADPLRGPETPVEYVMSRTLVTCSPDDDLDHVEALMVRSQKSRIIVLSAWRGCEGIVHLSDMGQVRHPEHAGALLKALSRPASLV